MHTIIIIYNYYYIINNTIKKHQQYMIITSSYFIASPNVTIGKEITSELEESETQYVHYPIPESGGITLQVNVNQGTIVLYASSVIQTPNEAFHDIKIVTNSYIYIDPNDLSDPDAGTVFTVYLLNLFNICNMLFS